MSRKSSEANKAAAGRSPVKKGDEEQVRAYMEQLEHPLKEEMEAVRAILKSADSRLGERIKWNAPSYYYREDIVTFNHRAEEHVHLVFHHPSIETISSPILEGAYKGRRMTYLKNRSEVEKAAPELVRVIRETLEKIDTKPQAE